MRTPPLARFVQLQRKDRRTGCRNWTGAKEKEGYGRFSTNGRKVSAHRWFYEYKHGPVEKGNHVHHTCHNTTCVALEHLDSLTPDKHMKHHSPARCPRGHPYDEENTRRRFHKGYWERECITCERARCRAKYQRLYRKSG